MWGSMQYASKRPDGCTSQSAAVLQAAVVVNATTDMKIYREETFGPAISIIKFKYDEEAIKLANDTEYGLASYFFTKARSLQPASSSLGSALRAHAHQRTPACRTWQEHGAAQRRSTMAWWASMR